MRFLSEPLTGILAVDAIDEARCAALLAELDRRGFEATGERYPRGYRDNDRLVFDDPELAETLYGTLRARLPAELVVDGERWTLCGLNPRFRACRYRDGQAFCIHRDGPYVPSADVRSHLTVQLYLDDAPALGGHTRFYADAGGAVLLASIPPRRGTVIIFDHGVWHDGEAVTRGVKHVLRTDALYRCESRRDLETVVGRHRGYAWKVIACRDGTLASAGRDGTVRRWGARPQCHAVHEGSVTALVEDARGRLWFGTRSGAIGTISVDSDEPAVVHVGDGAALAACAANDGVVFATSRGTLLAFGASCELAWTATAHEGWAWCATRYGDHIASCGEDGWIASTDRAGRSRRLVELGAPLRAIASWGDGLCAGDTRGWLHRLDRRGDTIAAIRAHDGAITSIAVLADGSWVTGSEDGRVRRWRDDRLVATAQLPDFVTSVAVADNRVICSSYTGAIRLAGV